MNKALIAIFACLVALGLGMNEAEAARMGGGKSFGAQRSVAPRPAPAQQAAPTAPNAPTAAPTAAPKRNWMGPIAGLAAGLGIAALLSHFGMGAGMANFLMIALLAMAAVFVLKLIFGRKTQQSEPRGHTGQALQYAGGDPVRASAPQFPAGAVAASAATPANVSQAANVPADFDSEGFVRVAKLNFVRLQAANDARNLDDIREFTSPELFAEIKMQMDERGTAPQTTDVVTLDADLLEVTTEGGRHVASVLFKGMIREEAGAAAAPFSEIWNLAKPLDGSRGWSIIGIQQVN